MSLASAKRGLSRLASERKRLASRFDDYRPCTARRMFAKVEGSTRQVCPRAKENSKASHRRRRTSARVAVVSFQADVFPGRDCSTQKVIIELISRQHFSAFLSTVQWRI